MTDADSDPFAAAVSPVIPGLPPEESRAANSPELHKAWAEAELLSKGFSAEELERDAAAREHGRNQRFRNHFELLAIVALWLSAGTILLLSAVWLCHMILPEKSRWLTAEDISHLQSIVTTGLLVGILGNHFKKRLN